MDNLNDILIASPGCAPHAFSCAPHTFSLDGVFPYFNLDSKTWFSLFLHGKCRVTYPLLALTQVTGCWGLRVIGSKGLRVLVLGS